MKTAFSALAVLSVVASNALGGSVTYSDKAAFIGASGAGAFSLNEFNDLNYFGFTPYPLTYSTGTPVDYVGPTYSISSTPPQPAFAIPGAVQFVNDSSGLFISIPAGSQAIGANIYATDVNYAIAQAFLTVELSDATYWGGLVSSTNDFIGFVAPLGGPLITSFSLSYTNDWSQPDIALYATVDNLYVVAAVPEPSVVAMNLAVVLATVGGAVCYRRRSQKNS